LSDSSAPPLHHHHKHWEASLGALTAAVLFLPLPDQFTLGPNWAPTAVVIVFLLPLTILQEAMRRPGGWTPSPRLARMLALGLLAVLTLFEAFALALLLINLPGQHEGKLLFRAAAPLWGVNLLVFALWYWELDGGGPARRPPADCPPTDFLFPQQTDPRLAAGWSPQFLDYVFLAFNTGTAFSPTDTMVLSRQAKATMMAQATISLLTIGLVVARGVNII